MGGSRDRRCSANKRTHALTQPCIHVRSLRIVRARIVTEFYVKHIILFSPLPSLIRSAPRTRIYIYIYIYGHTHDSDCPAVVNHWQPVVTREVQFIIRFNVFVGITVHLIAAAHDIGVRSAVVNLKIQQQKRVTIVTRPCCTGAGMCRKRRKKKKVGRYVYYTSSKTSRVLFVLR